MMKILPFLLLLLPTKAAAQSIVGFTLVTTRLGGIDVRPLVDGDVIDLAVEPTLLTVRAETTGRFTFFEFNVDDSATLRTDRQAPYYLGGDVEGVPLPVSVLEQIGRHTIKGSIYSVTQGGFIESKTIQFTVMDSTDTYPKTAPIGPSSDVTP